MSKPRTKKPIAVEPAIPEALAEAMKAFALSLIDHGLTAAEMQNVLTKAFLQAAAQRARLKNGRVNQSRVAIMTGLTRTEVRKHFEDGDVVEQESSEFGASRVINSWLRDPEFLTSDGLPKELPLNGRYGSFKSLARLYSGDIPARATLEELRRLGMVRVTRGVVKLLPQTASGRRKQERSLAAIGAQISEALSAIGSSNNGVTLVSSDSVSLDAEDAAAMQLLRQRCSQSAKSMLAGLETSSRNLAHEMRSKSKSNRGHLKVSITISETASSSN